MRDMKVIQSWADVQSLTEDEHLPSFYVEEIEKQFLLWYESENNGESIQDFFLPRESCIYHFNHVKDIEVLQKYVNNIEYIEAKTIKDEKYFRIGIMEDHQMSLIYFVEGTLPYKTEKWLEN